MCIKNFMKWANSKVKRLNFWDVQCIKLASAAFILTIAKLWEPLLGLNWYWYAIIAALASIKVIYRVFGK